MRTPRSSALVRESARRLRGAPTDAEVAIWEILRDRRLAGLKFRRQVAIDRFVVDFLCPRLRLVVETDGLVHDSEDQRARDRERSEILRSLGYTILRLTNDEVLQDPVAAARRIRAHALC